MSEGAYGNGSRIIVRGLQEVDIQWGDLRFDEIVSLVRETTILLGDEYLRRIFSR